MSDVLRTLTTGQREPLPAHRGGWGARTAASVSTPGGFVFVLVIVLVVAIALANPNFADPGVLIRFVGRTAPIAIAAMGQYFVIVSGEFDLSMAAVVTTQVVMAGNLIGQDSSRIFPVMLLMLAVGALIGLLNGLATTLLQVPSFIVTLGMMLALGGLVRYLTGGAATGNPVDEFRQIGRGAIENVPVVDVIPYPLLIFVVLAAAASWLMRRPFGRSLVAVGDNPAASAVLRDAGVVAQDPRLHPVVALRDGRRDHPGRVRRGAPLGRPGLRVHRHHRGRARRRAPRRRSRLGALRGGRSVRARAALHPAHLARGRLHVARHRAGPDHHPRRRGRRPRLAGRPPPTRCQPAPRSSRKLHHHARTGHQPEGEQLMRSRKMRGALVASAAVLALLSACSTDSSLDDPDAAGDPGDGESSSSEEWFVQADFDEQMEQMDATFEGDPSEPWLQYIDGEMTDTSEFAGGGGNKVCFANASISNPWRQTGWITMNQQLEVLEDSGVISEMETRDAQDDDNTQIADIDYFISEGNCDAFIISPNSTAAMTPAVERACETGKPVVVFDRGVETDCATTFIHPIGGYAWGIETANFLVDNLEEGDKVVALRILPGVDVLETRWAAAEKIFEENGIEAVDYFTGADPTEIKKIITDELAGARSRASGWTPVTVPSPPSRPSRTPVSTTRS